MATTQRTPRRKGAAASALLVSMVAIATFVWPTGAARAGAHEVHACVVSASGTIRIVNAAAECNKNETALSWERAGGAATTYSAGSGLALDANNQFSVTGAPWGGLTNVPAGFADNVDDDGSANVAQLRSDITGGSLALSGWSIVAGTVSASALAGSYDPWTGQETTAGAVTSEKIMDGTIAARDLSAALLQRLTALEAKVAELEARLAAVEAE